MPSMIKALVAVLAAAAPAFAELAMTAPIATTTCTGGAICQVAWNDNGSGVSLAQQGNCTIALYTGGAQQQTFLQPIAYPNAINVSTTAAVEFTVDPTIGPNGDDYFIRISSTTLNNPTSPTNPYLSFSAKFTLSGMTGTFNSTVQQQIAATGSLGSSTPAASSTGSGTSSSRSTTATTTRSSTSATQTGAAVKNSAAGIFVAGAAVAAGVVALF